MSLLHLATPEDTDSLLPLVAAYLEQVGVKMEIQPMEYGAFLVLQLLWVQRYHRSYLRITLSLTGFFI